MAAEETGTDSGIAMPISSNFIVSESHFRRRLAPGRGRARARRYHPAVTALAGHARVDGGDDLVAAGPSSPPRTWLARQERRVL